MTRAPTLADVWHQLIRLLHDVIRMIVGWIAGRGQRPFHPTRHGSTAPPSRPTALRVTPKPPWVRTEIIRMKALCPMMGCRTIAEVFNRRFAERGTSVGKTFVANTIIRHYHEIVRLRQELKHRVPRPGLRNGTWGLDLTTVGIEGRQRLVLGVLDHGTRACLRLQAIRDKSALTILRGLIETFRRYGLPSRIRVDNEPSFVSIGLRVALAFLGVRIQRIDPHCPWQNGRVERFFGTLKPILRQALMAHTLETLLPDFRAWYNHVRPHAHLGGRTPAEAWMQVSRSCRRPHWFSAWDGTLTGWYFPPGPPWTVR